MLRRRVRAALSIGALGLALSIPGRAARADTVDDDDLVRPQRLTVGVADDLLGQLDPEGKTLYFASNRGTTNQIFAQDLADGHARQLFDDGADVTWPRVSPDGRSLLYISFRDSASGELCVRRLPAGDDRRCLKGPSMALQAEWIDVRRIALVSRPSVEGDLRIEEVTTDGDLRARPLLDRNLTSPAISPDGKWLVYVPVERTVQTVGPAFAAHAAQTLEAVPLASAATATPTKIALQLPGQSGQPAFARDGRSIFLAQFFTDTNHDGALDGSDNGVLFRVPLSFDTGVPVAGSPEQLTETSWNCEYPAPFADRLIATCSQAASLDVYSMPLDGEVPAAWTTPQLMNAIDDADTLVEQQLLTSRWLARETTTAGRRHAMIALAMAHLQCEEFRAAAYYAELVHTLRDATTAGISLPLRLMVEQRRSVRRKEHGRLMEGFREQSLARLGQLRADQAPTPMAEDVTHLARHEIFDSLGDVGEARRELEAVTVDETTPEPIVESYYRHVDAFYRKIDDREALVASCRKLSSTPGLKPDVQLRYARAAARAMVRGVPYADADARLARERATVTAGETELAFALDVARAVAAIRDAHPPKAVGDALLALYAAQTRPGRRRALVVDAVQRADDLDADDVLVDLVERDVHQVKRGTHERGEVEDIYERIVMARAYEEAHAKRYDAARDAFDSVAEQTDSFVAVVGSIDMRLKMGVPAAAIEARYERPEIPAPRAAFAKAYLLARQLPTLEGDAHGQAVARARALLQSQWATLKRERIAQALRGALLHEEYLRTGDLALAERANVRYLLALELVGQHPRFRAMILGELGVLHTDVGNYRIALGYLLERDRLPYSDNTEGLDVLLSKAQALLHVGRDVEAAEAGDAALATIGRNPALATYRLLALDWAAIDNLSAGRFARALALYDEEIPLLDGSKEPLAARNQLVVRLARAAAAVGADQPARALADLDDVDARLADARTIPQLKWSHASQDQVVRAYRLMLAGLRAKANRELGRFDAEAQAIAARHAILDETREESARVEIEQQEMLAEAQLALNASARHDDRAIREWLGRALGHADDLRARANGVSSREQLDVLRLAAELALPSRGALVPDLGRRLSAAATELATRREPALRSYERWFEIYGALLANDASR